VVYDLWGKDWKISQKAWDYEGLERFLGDFEKPRTTVNICEHILNTDETMAHFSNVCFYL